MFDPYAKLTNALQLSLSTPIQKIVAADENFTGHIAIVFLHDPRHSKQVQKFIKMLQPDVEWEKDENTLIWKDGTHENVLTITEILLLTRLEDSLLRRIAEINPKKFKVWIDKLKLTLTNKPQDAGEQVFAKLLQKKLTQTELAKKANLSLVTLHKFKKGGDIRLSNFLNLLNALDLQMVIKEKK